MAEDLDISTSVEFVKGRVEATFAAQLEINSVWQCPSKSLAEWEADLGELNAANPASLAGKLLAEAAAYQQARGVLDGRLREIKETNVLASGVMRVRAKQDPALAQAVSRLKAKAASWAGIEREGAATLATWTSVFTAAFTPAPGKTLAGFKVLFDGDDSDPADVIPSLQELKAAHKQAEKKARLATGKYNQLITRLEDECTQWYAEATKVFRKNTAEGAMIRGSVPTSDDHNPPTAAPIPITISAASVTGPTTVLITYATDGGGGATSRKLQWRLASAGTWTEYGTVIRPNQIVSHPSWAQQSVVFRVEVSNSKGMAHSPEVTVGL